MKTQPTEAGTVQIQKAEMAGNLNSPNYAKYYMYNMYVFYG